MPTRNSETLPPELIEALDLYPPFHIITRNMGDHLDVETSCYHWQLLVYDYTRPPGEPISEIVADGETLSYDDAIVAGLDAWRTYNKKPGAFLCGGCSRQIEQKGSYIAIERI